MVVPNAIRLRVLSAMTFHEKAGRSQVGSSPVPIPKQGFFSTELPLSPPFHPHSG